MSPIVVPPSGDQRGVGSPTEALPGTGASAPAGLEALLEYNGIILGDTTVIDKYRVMEIDGLHDADIRDSRENNPSAHGETAFTPYYGGRTITIRGRIEAHNVAKLRDMQQALRTAFSSLSELPLYFRMSDSSHDHYINCRKSSPINMTETQADGTNFYREFLITLRASNPRFLSVTEKTAILYPNLCSNPSFEVDLTGWTTSNVTVSGAVNARQTGWSSYGTASYRASGTATSTNSRVGAYWTVPTGAMTPGVDYTFYADINVLNAAVTGAGGQIIVQWVNSGGGVISTIQTAGTGTSTGLGYMQLTGTAPALTSYAFVYVLYVTTTNTDVIDFYFDNVRVVRGTYSTVPPGKVSITNEGSFQSEPRIRIYGQVAAPFIYNGTNNKFFLANTVTAGTYNVADIGKRTYVSNTGVNKFGDLNILSSWLWLEPGTNEIWIDGAQFTTDPNGRVEIYYRDSWI